MAHFIIKNIGPINHTEFDLNRVNVFIGPQSVGKSTIAKIISFCLWLEKTTIRQQHVDNIDLSFVEEYLVSFHKMSSYFNPESYIHYEGKAITFDYIYKSSFQIHKSTNFSELETGKVAYVPAERNIVSMAYVGSFKFEYDYVRDFVFEWLGIRSKYSQTDAIHIPGTDVKYFFDEKRGDIIELPNHKSISLNEASSGLQSVIPLYIYCLYVSEWIYQHNMDMSYEDADKIIEGVSRMTYNALRQEADSNEIFKGDRYEDNAEMMTMLIRNIFSHTNETALENTYKTLTKFADRIRKPHFTQLIIEEPELNLFPETQVELLYALLRLLQNNRPDNLVVTTHSPYILYALNNCLLANIVRGKMPKTKFDKVRCSDVVLDSQEVSVFELENGEFRPIEQNVDTGKYTMQDDFGLIRQNFFDHVMKGIMDDFNSLLKYRF